MHFFIYLSHIEEQKTDENMLNIISCQRNGSQNHKNVQLYTEENGYNKNLGKLQTLAGMQSEWNYHTLLIEM